MHAEHETPPTGKANQPSAPSARSTEALRVLLVSYNFPPVGGAGVQRATKLVKYIHAYGVDATVLTVSNPSVPLVDESLAAEVPRNVRVIRARTLEPSYRLKRTAWNAAASRGPLARATDAAKLLLVPDAQVLWLPAASAALCGQLASRTAPDVVCITAPPFSQFLLAQVARLRRRSAVVLDYRDEWSTYREAYEMMGRTNAAVGEWLEPRLLGQVDAVVTATEAFRDELLRRFPFLRPEYVRAIPNGYDVSDFPAELPGPPPDRFVLTYAGTVLRLNSPRGLIAAIRRVHSEHPELARLLRVRFVGRIVETEVDAFAGAAELGIECIPYLPHQQLLPELSGSHLTTCVLDDVPGTERMYPGKIFELLYLGRKCLVLAPGDCALARLVRQHEFGEVIAPRDEHAIAAALVRYLSEFTRGTYSPTTKARSIERYDRRNVAREFAETFRLALERRRGSRQP